MNPITVFLGGPATPRHEHHLRDDQGARHCDPDADIDGRQHEFRRSLGIGGAGQDRTSRCNWVTAAEQPFHATEKRFQSRRAFTCLPVNLMHGPRGLGAVAQGVRGWIVSS
jgi:hypothetical protein